MSDQRLSASRTGSYGGPSVWPYFLRSTLRASRVRNSPSAELGLQVGRNLLEGAGDSEEHSAGLGRSCRCPAHDEDVDPVTHLRGSQRCADVGAVCLFEEVGVDLELVDDELAGPLTDADPSDRGSCAGRCPQM